MWSDSGHMTKDSQHDSACQWILVVSKIEGIFFFA